MHYLLLFLALALVSCSSEEHRLRKQNLKGEYVYRLHDEYFFKPPPPLPQTRADYPWEGKCVRGLPRITKEFFRCKGNPLNPMLVQANVGKEPIKYFDCQGGRKHGLPIREGQEFVYPCLIELLNYLQEHTGKRVVITCGHCCPKHSAYTNHSPYNWGSKHMISAEVDFYVEGMENQPHALIPLIQQYYTHNFPDNKEYTQFARYEKEDLNISTPPWYNKELFIKLYLEHEGRDCDNQHPYPYLGIQVRFDRDSNSKVTFDPKQAQNYLRP